MSTMTVELYLSADAKTRAGIRANLKAATDAAVRDGDFAKASEIVALSDAIKAATKATESTVDVNAILSDRAATLEAAAAFLRQSGMATLPGSADDKEVAKLTSIPTRKAGRGDVVAWVASVVDSTPATIATLRNRWTPTDDYAEQAPSAGAIGAAFKRLTEAGTDGAEVGFKVTTVDGKAAAVGV